MSIEVSTNRTARERMAEWQTVQLDVWDEIERIASLYSELATLTNEEIGD